MINSTELQNKVVCYQKKCNDRQKSPTYLGLSTVLGVAPQTIANVVHGQYNNGHFYTERPHTTRCIDNDDFEVIRSVFNNI